MALIEMANMANASVMFNNRKIDWNMHCLCQKDKSGEEVKSPPSHHAPEQDGYTMMARNFSELNEIPLIMNPARLDEGIVV